MLGARVLLLVRAQGEAAEKSEGEKKRMPRNENTTLLLSLSPGSDLRVPDG